MPWSYYILRPLVRIALFLLTRWQVSGKENIPRKGPLLVVANHLSLADPLLLGFVLNRPVKYMAKIQLFRHRVMAAILRHLGAFPVQRGRPDRRAFRQAEEVLAQGYALVVFPEGTRSRSAQLRDAFPGPALIALRSGALILPVGITGTEKLEHWSWFLRRPRITVRIGPPFHLPPTAKQLTRRELANYIMEHIAQLLPPEYQGTYARRRK